MKISAFFAKLSLLFCCCLALAGCAGDRASNLPGIWEVREGSASVEAPKALENVDTPEALAGALATLAPTELTLNPDNTFLIKGTLNAQGTWVFDDATGDVTLTSQSAPTPVTMKANLSKSGQLLSLPNPMAGAKPIELQKRD